MTTATPADLLTQPMRDTAAMLDCKSCAALLRCSVRHWYRLVDSGRAPAGIKLGSLIRWSRRAVEDWIAAGCPPCRKGVKP